MRVTPPITIFIVAALTACISTPSLDMLNSTRSTTQLEGRTFTVFLSDDKVEVVREGFANSQDQKQMRPKMLTAVAQATGCKPLTETFKGDSSVQRGEIDCR